MEILILDSGVSSEHPFFKEEKFEGYELEYDEGKDEVTRRENIKDANGHGTAVCYLIRKKTRDADIKVIKIFDKELVISENALIRILEYVADNESPQIINMSFGITQCRRLKDLHKQCKRLFDKGVIITSAFDNNGSVSYPAAFDSVLGIHGAADIFSDTVFDFVEDSIVNIVAKGSLTRIAWISPDYIVTNGNSFACASITGMIAEKGLEGFDNAVEYFKKNARNVYYGQYERDNSLDFEIAKAAVFPFSKEMHSLIRFSSALSFEISGIYDIKYSGRVGASTAQLMNENGIPKYIVADIDGINWDSFDTLILGHLDELSSYSKKQNLTKDILDNAIERNKNVYAFDRIDQQQVDNANGRIFYPSATRNNIPLNRFGKLYRISKPVLGVFGTSSKQGKFTLQMILRKALTEQGYNVGQLGSEPSSLLYGFDEVFPFGYNGTADVFGFEAIALLNEKMFNISKKDYDIIIVGSQSGTVPYDLGNLKQYPVQQASFLYGTSPDAVILNINPYDDLNYVRRTISFIEGAVYSKVVSLCLFPMGYKAGFGALSGAKEKINEQACSELKVRFSRTFNIPVGILGEQEDERLIVQSVIDFFSGGVVESER